MGRFAFIFVAGMAFAGSAHASSFVTLEAMNAPMGPSMVAIGSPADAEGVPVAAKLSYPFPTAGSAPGIVASAMPRPEETKGTTGTLVDAGPSIITMGEALDGMDSAETPRRQAHFSPMVIRGGIVGDAFTRPAQPAPAQEAETASNGAPDPVQTSAQRPTSQPTAAPDTAQEESAPSGMPEVGSQQ